MPPRFRRFAAEFLEFALLVAILVSVAHFKGITGTPKKVTPTDSYFCDPRTMILVDDSPRDGLTERLRNEGTSEPYGLAAIKSNCTSRGKRR